MLPWRCDVRGKFASHPGSRGALDLDLFEPPGKERVCQHRADGETRERKSNSSHFAAFCSHRMRVRRSPGSRRRTPPMRTPGTNASGSSKKKRSSVFRSTQCPGGRFPRTSRVCFKGNRRGPGRLFAVKMKSSIRCRMLTASHASPLSSSPETAPGCPLMPHRSGAIRSPRCRAGSTRPSPGCGERERRASVPRRSHWAAT